MADSGKRRFENTESERAAAIIAHTARELSRIAERSGLDVLARILDLARIEAELRMGRAGTPRDQGS